jgi:hypothetical protein
VCHLTETNSAKPELTVNRMWTTAALATGVTANFELRGFVGFIPKTGFRHDLSLLEWEAQELK